MGENGIDFNSAGAGPPISDISDFSAILRKLMMSKITVVSSGTEHSGKHLANTF